jgi:hypothetical protein
MEARAADGKMPPKPELRLSGTYVFMAGDSLAYTPALIVFDVNYAFKCCGLGYASVK